MQLGMVGLGRMGANMVRRLSAGGVECVAFDRNADTVAALVSEVDGVEGANSFEELVAKLEGPRAIWIMVPAAATGSVVDELAVLCQADDIIVDGGNTHYPLDIARSDALRPQGIHYVDVGTSGGVHGLERGYCLMIGGEPSAVQRLQPVFRALAPGLDAAPRTEGNDGEPKPAELGFMHCGPSGAGHFVKMVHNGVEYAIMQAYAEGFAILNRANIGSEDRGADAETAPMSDPRLFQYDINEADVAELWRRGSVIGSWLLDLTAAAMAANPELDNFEGTVSDSGEGRWAVEAAVQSGTPAPTISQALFSRFSSRDNDLFANKVLSAMRAEFGGHDERKKDD